MKTGLVAVVLVCTLVAAAQELKTIAKLESSTAIQFAEVCKGGGGVVGVGKDGTVYSWHLPDGKVERSFSADKWASKRRVRNVSCSEKWIALGLQDGSVALVDRAKGTEAKIQLGTSPVAVAEISPDSTLLAGAVADSPAELWDMATMKKVAVLRNDFGGCSGVAFTPDSKRVASADEDTLVRIYDHTGKLLGASSQFPMDTFGLRFVDGGKALAVAGVDGTVTILDGTTGAQLRQTDKDNDMIFGMISAPDDHTVAVVYLDNFLLTPTKIGVWDTRSAKLVRTLSPKNMIGAGAGKTELLMIRMDDEHTTSVLALQ
jgi:WD40 repeat protein